MNKKPPDKVNTIADTQIYRTIKCPLKAVLKQYHSLQPKINQVVHDMNQLVTQVDQCLKLFLIDLFQKEQPLPEINKDLIMDIFRVVGYTQFEKKLSEKSKRYHIKKQLKMFYQTSFQPLIKGIPKISYTCKNYIVEELAKEIYTCLKTNLSTHFHEYIRKYINVLFRRPQEQIINAHPDPEIRSKAKYALRAELRKLKMDLLSNTMEQSDSKYHQWMKDNRSKFLPKNIEHNVVYDCKKRPEQYLQYALYLNQQIELLGGRPYQVIPQRTNIVPKNITINTSALVTLLHDKTLTLFAHPKRQMTHGCKQYQQHAWAQVLKLEKRSIFQQGRYVFFNQIKTDGISCSLLFIDRKYVDKKFVDKLPKPEEEEENKIPTLHSLTAEQCAPYRSDQYCVVGVDPGKNKLVTMADNKGNFYHYSCYRRRQETFAFQSLRIIQKEKEKTGQTTSPPMGPDGRPKLQLKQINVIEEETKLSQYKSRTLNPVDYQRYVEKKNQINQRLQSFYQRLLFRTFALRRFCRTKSAEARMLNEIEHAFLTPEDRANHKKILLGYGDWSRSTQMKGFMPTPGLGLRRLIASRFDMLIVNEDYTSQIHFTTGHKLINAKVKIKDKMVYLHEVLTLKGNPGRLYVNRDKNAAQNILKITQQYLLDQTRPLAYCSDGQFEPLLDAHGRKKKLFLKTSNKKV